MKRPGNLPENVDQVGSWKAGWSRGGRGGCESTSGFGELKVNADDDEGVGFPNVCGDDNPCGGICLLGLDGYCGVLYDPEAPEVGVLCRGSDL